jgi:hypothetical protein
VAGEFRPDFTVRLGGLQRAQRGPLVCSSIDSVPDIVHVFDEPAVNVSAIVGHEVRHASNPGSSIPSEVTRG